MKRNSNTLIISAFLISGFILCLVFIKQNTKHDTKAPIASIPVKTDKVEENIENTEVQQSKTTDEILDDLTRQWNEANNYNGDLESLSNLYYDHVFYYGTKLKKSSCLSGKKDMFKKYSNFNQEINGSIEVKEISSNLFRTEFLKTVRFGKKLQDFPSYLEFKKENDKWYIVTEGDLVTDRNLLIRKFKNSEVYEYGIEGTEMKGTLITKEFYGAPGYGETPEEDEKVYPYILKLDKPIKIEKDPNDENTFTVDEISEIQLAPKEGMNLHDLIGKKILVKGEIFEAHTAHHYTPVLILLEEIF